jgi:uncharacterized damage-inducible protein DinB
MEGVVIVSTEQSTDLARQELLEVLAAQRAGLRNAVRGLSEAQATAQPTASSLCVGGLIKHVARTERGWISVRLAGRPDPDPPVAEQWSAEFQLGERENVPSALVLYEEVARETEEIVRALPDLDYAVKLPEAPWFPPNATWTARRILLHVIAETARHAGHADIIRESLDGATAYELLTAD